jgi:hypothetical protein
MSNQIFSLRIPFPLLPLLGYAEMIPPVDGVHMTAA